MAVHLLRDLSNLQRDLLSLASLVEETIHKSARALQDRDPKIARAVIAADAQIDLEENQLHEDCLKILALHQPVAIDLRRIVSTMMITTDLERMGDLAEEIAERALTLCNPPHLPVPGKLKRMADIARRMVGLSLDAFVNMNKDQAEEVLVDDDEVDRCNDEIIQEIIRAMKRSPDMVEPGLSMFSATRHLERIADHATNIAEDVIYLVEGEIVRHRPPAPTAANR
jgi:phosphate transport system protein